jgi:hypothetical protein
MVRMGPVDQQELEIYRPVLRAQEEERERLRHLRRLFAWQGVVVLMGCLFLVLVVDEDVRVAAPLALVLAIALFDLALLLVHFIAARKRVGRLREVAEERIQRIRSDSVERFRLISPCWKCGANVLHAFVWHQESFVTRRCLFCHAEWKEERP